MRWVWKLKHTGRYKARLVACESVGRFQTPSIEKFSPTIGTDSLRLIYVIGTHFGCDFFSLDISGAYLTGTRPPDEPDVYLTLPPGLKDLRDLMNEMKMKPDPRLAYHDKRGRAYCLFLKGNLYGTQLAGKAFWEHARSWLVNELGFSDTKVDPCIFCLWRNGSFIIVGLYVDDAIVASNSVELKEWFLREFTIKFNQSADSGDPVYLGISYEVHEKGKYVSLNTPLLWDKLAKRIAGMGITLPKTKIPLPKNAMELLYADPSHDNPLIDPKDFNVREILGITSWAVHAVRPGEVFSTSLIARRAHIPTANVIAVLLCLVSYLLDHKDDCLHVTNDGFNMFKGASDASHANDQDVSANGPRSWFGYCLHWGGIAFMYRSKLLPYIAPSTRDAETGALVYCVKAMIGVLVLMYDLGFKVIDSLPVRIDVDSTAAINSITTDWIHRDSRWNAIRTGFLRDFVRSQLIKPYFVTDADMLADPLTKVATNGKKHETQRTRLMGTPPT
jgi:hypothetical protein